MQLEHIQPNDIEKRSFEIIESELCEMGIKLPDEEAPITKRAIHASADFDYARTLVYSKNAVATARGLLRGGACIVTDTNMALAGINKTAVARLGCTAQCFMADENVAAVAKERGATRASVSMEMASRLEKPVIFVIGNAPTALVQLYEMYQQKIYTPAFIIGVPVGFVNVVAAKELIMQTDISYIINKGRKGGSNIAAAICNAILYGMER